ncbi:MAG TPA: NADH-quinone oxidoreductase subunit N [Coriobacteriia bacterium]|nr:NADH-quinone oxidoreductase subunit N [Coriobacteriia bacterium]
MLAVTDMNVTMQMLLPEIIVAATGALVLILDLIWVRPLGAAPSARPWLAYVGIAGLALAAVATVAERHTSAALFSNIFVVDPLAVFFKVLFIGIAIIVLLYSVETLPRFTRWPAEFYALMIWCTLGHMMLASSNELFTIFLSLQLTSLPLIVLIGYAKHDGRSGEAAIKYLLLVLVSTAVLLYGMSLVYGSLGTSTLPDIGAELAKRTTIGPALILGLVLLLTGFAFKIAAVPFQFWVPDVYEGAPTPVTAFLSVGSKFAGFALALRIVVTALRIDMDWHITFGVMAALSMFFGNLSAIRQSDMKRMLAYSGIAQAGYLLVGLASLSQEGVGGLLFYTVAYGCANLAAFGVVMIVAEHTKSTRIQDYAGLARRSPLVGLSLAVALLSLGGLPLMAGFMAKFYVFVYAAKAGLIWLVAIGVMNSVISLYYYLRVVWQLYVPAGEDLGEMKVPVRSSVALTFCVAGVLTLGIFPEPVMQAAQAAAAALFGG